MRLLLVGFGVVGRALVELIEEQRGSLYASTGLAPRVVGVLDSRGAAMCPDGFDARTLIEAKERTGTVGGVDSWGRELRDPLRLIETAEADLLVETSPSDLAAPEAAIARIRSAMGSGKHVISVNKAPLAVALPGLMELAEYNRVEFRFSGTVGAGTPVLTWARHCAMGDRIERVQAILNGTTNFILWSMQERGTTFDDALVEAQRLGYAETDPTADVDGIDAAIKVVIIANWVLGRAVTMNDVEVEGIRGVSLDRIKDAATRGKTVKLIGAAEPDSGVLEVRPTEIDSGSPLDVPASLNAVTLTLRHGGEITLVGRGAGGVETATSIMRDMLDVWRTTEVC